MTMPKKVYLIKDQGIDDVSWGSAGCQECMGTGEYYSSVDSEVLGGWSCFDCPKCQGTKLHPVPLSELLERV